MTKQRAFEILKEHVKDIRLVRHNIAVSFAMGAIYDYLREKKLLEEDGINKETWETVGLLHDSDYEYTKEDHLKHTLLTLEWLEKEGVSKDDPMYKTIASHNTKRTNLKPVESQMEWALECVDELTGFIVACALVKDKKLSNVTVDTIKKKWKDPTFAKGVIRKQVEQCEEKLNIPLDMFYEITLCTMVAHSSELGL